MRHLLLSKEMKQEDVFGPVSTSVLAQKILSVIKEVPVFVAGEVSEEMKLSFFTSKWEEIAGCQLGARFVCSYESMAHLSFKQAFIKVQARDVSCSVQLDPRFPIIPVKTLVNQATQDFQKLQSQVIVQVDGGQLDSKEAQ